MSYFTPGEVEAFRNAAPANYTPKATQAKQTKGLGGFIERNLPTIGGVVGGIATAPLEALDAVSGVGGTALNVAGASAGQALGQKLKNSLTGSTDSTATAGLTGGLGELGGRAVSKGLGTAAKLFSKPIDKGVANIAGKKAAVTASNEVSPFASVAGNQDVEGAVNLMKAHGMEATPEAMKTAANVTTGNNGELSNTLRQVLGGNGGEPIKVDVGNYLDHVKGAINDEPLLGMAEAKTGSGAKLMASIAKNKENNLFGGEGSLTQKANGNDVLDSIQYHQKQAARFKNAAPGSEGEAIGNVHKQAANYLEKQLSTSAGADKAVAAHTLSDQDAQDILDNVKDKGGSPQLGKHIVDTINNSKSVADLRSAQAPFVKAAQLAGKAQDYAKGKGFVNELAQDAATKTKQAGGSGFSGLTNVYEAGAALHGNPIAAGTLAYKAAKTEPVVNAGNKLLTKGRAINDAPQNVLSKLTRGKVPATSTLRENATNAADNLGASTSETQPALKEASKQANNQLATRNTLARLGVSTGGQAAGQALNESGGQSDNQQTKPLSGGELLGHDSTFGADNSSQSPDSTSSASNDPFGADSIKQAIQEDLANGGKNVSQLISLYNTFGKPADTQSASEQTSADNLNGALATLGTYNDQLTSAGGGRGAVGGRVEDLLGKFGLGGGTATQVRAIESQKTDVATSIAKALTNGKPSSAQIKSWEDAIPSSTDSPAVAKQKIANITASIQAKLQSLDQQ